MSVMTKKIDAEDDEGAAPAVRRDEPEVGERSEDGRAAPVAGHGQADGEAALVREPLRHDGNRRRVAEAVPDADEDAEADDQIGQAAGPHAEDEARRQEDAAGERDPEGPELVLQPPREDEGDREDDDGPGEDEGRVRPLPAELLLQRRDEDAPGIQRAERQVHEEAPDDAPGATERFLFHGLLSPMPLARLLL